MTIDKRHLRDLITRASPLPWLLATSNSWRRIVDANHAEVCTPCTQPDGHHDLWFVGGYEGANAQLLIEAVNSLPVLIDILDTQAADIVRLRAALADAQQSLNTIATLGGSEADFMGNMRLVREYANSRARVARAALAQEYEEDDDDDQS